MAIVPGVAATCHRGEEVSDGTVVWVGDARAPKKGHGRHFARAQRTFSLVARTTQIAPSPTNFVGLVTDGRNHLL